jgi:Putative auto-transporter adhesin, head GIN domain
MRRSSSPFRRPLLFAGGLVVLLSLSPARAAPSSEVRRVEAFSAIALRGSIDLQVRQGGPQRVEVSADAAALPSLQTTVEVRDGVPTLMVQWARTEPMRQRGPARVTVDVTTLSALSAAGSGDIGVQALRTPALALSIAGSSDARLRELDTARLRISIAGSGDVVASGRAETLDIAIAGSGDVQARELASETATVSISGSGDAAVRATRSLSVSIAGSGDVEYSGGASLAQSRVVGSGTVRQRP